MVEPPDDNPPDPEPVLPPINPSNSNVHPETHEKNPDGKNAAEIPDDNGILGDDEDDDHGSSNFLLWIGLFAVAFVALFCVGLISKIHGDINDDMKGERQNALSKNGWSET